MINLQKLREAEELLSKAKTVRELSAAHAMLKSALHQTRKTAVKVYGALAETYKEAVRIWDRQKSEGASVETRQQVMENTLRAAWPKGREWHYACERCCDTGWIHRRCTPTDRCDGESTASHAWNSPMGARKRLCRIDPNYEHEYIEPCVCFRGNQPRAMIEASRNLGTKRPKSLDETGKTPTRVGR